MKEKVWRRMVSEILGAGDGRLRVVSLTWIGVKVTACVKINK